MKAVKLFSLLLTIIILFWGGGAAAQVKQYSAQVQERFNDLVGKIKSEPPAAPAVKAPPSSPTGKKSVRSRRRTFFIPRRLIKMLAEYIDRKSKNFDPAYLEKKPPPYSSQLRSVLEGLIFKNHR